MTLQGSERPVLACAVVCPPCLRPRAEGDRSFCAMHAHYFRVVLADPWYRNHPCPEPDAPQLPLRLALEVGE